MVCIAQYDNTGASAIPLSFCAALAEGRVQPGMTILTASFGAGLTCGAGIIRWGDRVEPLQHSDADIEPLEGTVFDLMKDSFAYYGVDAEHLLATRPHPLSTFDCLLHTAPLLGW